ncbi:NmrA family NAD(P)-binding protein, partial [Mycobacterium tuberculosis]|nr:NmrA family NAD(P)-binding protein [Mycobacterium tuberculosis]
MIITVFGATGQVGRRVVQSGLEKGYRVRAFGRNV